MAVAKSVKRVVATNPVAQAVAFRLLVSKVNLLSLHFHMCDEGSDVSLQILDANELLSIVLQAMLHAGHHEEPDYRVMLGAQSAMVDVSNHEFKWRKRHAVAIDEGIRRSLEWSKRFSALQLRQAWLSLR